MKNKDIAILNTHPTLSYLYRNLNFIWVAKEEMDPRFLE